MPVVEFVTPDQLAAVLSRVADLEEQLRDYVESVDDDIDTATAMRITGIRSPTTLDKVRAAGYLGFRKEGTKCLYSRRACIDYKRARRLGKPALGHGLRVAS